MIMALNISGQKVSVDDIVAVSRNYVKVSISENLVKKINASRGIVDKTSKSKKVVYGLNTGFGALINKVIAEDEIEKLQENLIISHSVGVGNNLPTETVRGIILLSINNLAKGFSGVRLELITALINMLNNGVHPLVPEKGSVGSSGDLVPSAHMALVLIGRGLSEYQNNIFDGKTAMKKAGIKPIKLKAKEGLAIINNTHTMTSIAAHLVYDSKWLLKVADIASALSLQALAGTDVAYNPKIHNLKPHNGQVETAYNLRELIKESTFIRKKRIQEPYSFRCVPQIYGAVRDAMKFVRKIVEVEINSVTDNPLIFSQGDILSGGNFHGEAVAIAMDTFGIALSKIANASDRRIATLLDPNHNNGLPAFLSVNSGVNSGLMILQYTTASLVSENKVLAHPASVDSIPTSANVEDIVSMGTIAARKAREIFENVANVITIELIVACQGIDLREKGSNKKLRLSPPTEKVFKFIRGNVPYFSKDALLKKYIENIRNHLEEMSRLPQSDDK